MTIIVDGQEYSDEKEAKRAISKARKLEQKQRAESKRVRNLAMDNARRSFVSVLTKIDRVRYDKTYGRWDDWIRHEANPKSVVPCCWYAVGAHEGDVAFIQIPSFLNADMDVIGRKEGQT